MTTYSLPRGMASQEEPASPSVPASMPGRTRAPIVVLTYELSGAELLSELLARSGSVACTAGTGIVPLCREVAQIWNRIDDRLGEPSTLAIASIRALAGAMTSVILAGAGGVRWCETVIAPPDTARAFLAAFPGTTVLCLHRRLDGVLTDALRAYPWGLAKSSFWPYSGRHRGNNVAAITEYWADRTQALLSFENATPQLCWRLKYEDLARDDGERSFDELRDYLGLPAESGPPRPVPKMAQCASGPLASTTLHDADVPSELIERAGELYTQLRYAPYFQQA